MVRHTTFDGDESAEDIRGDVAGMVEAAWQDDGGDRSTCVSFVQAVVDLAVDPDDGVDLVGAGRYAPEGIVGDYPPLWAEFRVEGAVYNAAPALNRDAVDIHLMEPKGDGSAVLTIRPACDFDD